MSFNEGDFEMDPTKQNPEIKRNDESFEIGPNDVTPDLREVPDEQTPEEEPLVNITGKKITEVFPSLEDDEIVLEDIPEKKRNDA